MNIPHRPTCQILKRPSTRWWVYLPLTATLDSSSMSRRDILSASSESILDHIVWRESPSNSGYWIAVGVIGEHGTDELANKTCTNSKMRHVCSTCSSRSNKYNAPMPLKEVEYHRDAKVFLHLIAGQGSTRRRYLMRTTGSCLWVCMRIWMQVNSWLKKHVKYRTSPASINTMEFHNLATCEMLNLHQGGQQCINIHPDGMSTCPQVRSYPTEGDILRESPTAV